MLGEDLKVGGRWAGAVVSVLLVVLLGGSTSVALDVTEPVPPIGVGETFPEGSTSPALNSPLSTPGSTARSSRSPRSRDGFPTGCRAFA